jgi:hypothetical protein
MSKIFNKQITLPKCKLCQGDSWQRNEFNEIIQLDGVDQRCYCYYANKFLEANIGFDYWMVEPDNFQGEPEDLEKVMKYFGSVHEMKAQGRGFFIYGPDYGTGKALDIDTDVITPNGLIKINDLKINDLIIGQNGKPTKVIGIYPQGQKDAFKVTFNDNTSVICCDEHLWKVRYGNNKFKVMTLKEIYKNYLNSFGYANYSIPLVEPVNFEKKPITIHPYILGALLGDGGFSTDSVKFTSIDEEILENIKVNLQNDTQLVRIGNSITYNFKKTNHNVVNNLYKPNTNYIYDCVKEMGLIGKLSFQKYIPHNYLFNSV